jgi:hypothetical protein
MIINEVIESSSVKVEQEDDHLISDPRKTDNEEKRSG